MARRIESLFVAGPAGRLEAVLAIALIVRFAWMLVE